MYEEGVQVRGFYKGSRVGFQKTELFDQNEDKNGTCLEVFDKLVSVVAGAMAVAADVLYVDTVLPKSKKLKVKVKVKSYKLKSKK